MGPNLLEVARPSVEVERGECAVGDDVGEYVLFIVPNLPVSDPDDPDGGELVDPATLCVWERGRRACEAWASLEEDLFLEPDAITSFR